MQIIHVSIFLKKVSVEGNTSFFTDKIVSFFPLVMLQRIFIVAVLANFFCNRLFSVE